MGRHPPSSDVDSFDVYGPYQPQALLQPELDLPVALRDATGGLAAQACDMPAPYDAEVVLHRRPQGFCVQIDDVAMTEFLLEGLGGFF